ncbi:hypothetical protein [Streptomyces sp. NPDC050504]|uniref:hypothetical protein n=1 Tax=Streptomyces sp. NPDC050504 TaxID=3365618 RepID=UPI00379045A5
MTAPSVPPAVPSAVPPAVPSAREGGIGRGVHALIPSAPANPSAGERATAALAPLRTVPVRAAAVEAAVLLLTELGTTAQAESVRDACAETVAHLRAALARP